MQENSVNSLEDDGYATEKADRTSICSTRLSEISLNRSSFSTIHDESFMDTDRYNFKKTGSEWNSSKLYCEQKSQCNEKTQGGNRKRIERSDTTYGREIMELQDIQRKTEQIVLKEKEQRKQLKRLKKVYEETVASYEALKMQHQKDTQKMHLTIGSLEAQQHQNACERENLSAKISELKEIILRKETELRNLSLQRETLWRKLELIDANCYCRYKQDDSCDQSGQNKTRIQEMISFTNQLDQLRKEVEIIDSTILKKKKGTPTYAQLQDIISLYQLRRSYNDSIERLLLDSQRQRFEHISFKLNRIILNNYRKCNLQDQLALSTEAETESVLFIDENHPQISYTKDILDSKFAQTNSTVISCQLTSGREGKWNKIKEEISNIIEGSVISGHQELFQHMEELAVGLIELCQLDCDTYQYGSFVSQVMSQLNGHLISKAKKHYGKIQALMGALARKDCSE